MSPPVQWERPPARTRWHIVAATVAAVTTLLVLTVRGGQDRTPDETLSVERTTEQPQPSRPESTALTPPALGRLPSQPGEWALRPSAPVRPSGTYGGVWAGDSRGNGELVVMVGGSDSPREAAAYDPGTRHWRRLPPIPESVRRGAGYALVWTGSEVIVWGRWEPTRTLPLGAAYDPSANTWRELPRAPIEDLGPSPVSVWTGTELIVWGPQLERVFRAGGTTGAAYDPDNDLWRSLPPAPISRSSRVGGVWTSGGLVVWGSVPSDEGQVVQGAASFTIVFDPRADVWSRLDPPPVDRPARAAATALDGSSVLIWGRPSTEDPLGPPDGAVLDPSAGRWQRLPTLAAGDWAIAEDLQGLNAAWTGDRVVVVGGSGVFRPVSLELVPTPEWRVLSDPPFPSRTGPVTVWTGEELLVWGGIHPTLGPMVDLQSWTPTPPVDG